MLVTALLSAALAVQTPLISAPLQPQGAGQGAGHVGWTQAPGIPPLPGALPGGLPQVPAGPRPVRSLVDLNPDDDPFDLGLLAISAPPGVFMQVALTSSEQSLAVPSTSYSVTILQTGTGYQETYRIQLPAKVSFEPSPLLVAFHGFGQSANAVTIQTSYEQECFDRNWFLVIPLGASKKGFGALPCQTNIELVLQQVFGAFGPWIDRERIYGVGFSMGGADCLNFIARHLDNPKRLFAAAVNHTGAVNRKFTYWSDAAVQWIFEFWHGGSPSQFPFEYERTGLIDFDLVTHNVDPTNDMARNLGHVPVRSYEALLDPLVISNGVSQSALLHSHLGQLHSPTEMIYVPGNEHAWSTVDETEVCDWLSRNKLKMPSSGDLLADRDGTWLYFYVEQDTAGAFTPFSFDIDVGANRIDVVDTENLKSITIAPKAAGLDPYATLEVRTSASDVDADQISLLAYRRAPSAVLRDGNPIAAWTWNPATQTLTLHEFDGSMPHLWTVVP